MYGIITLHDVSFKITLIIDFNGITSRDYNSIIYSNIIDSHLELFPLHSPLLGESLLVSFPPLSYMLKSSGSSYLISGPIYNFYYTISIIYYLYIIINVIL